MCHVIFELNVLPFSTNTIVLLLSCYIVVVGTCSPCTARKFLVQSTCPITSSTATSLASVKLFVFHYCLHEAVYVAPSPSVIYIPIDFSCLGVRCKSCLPTTLVHHLVRSLKLDFLYFLGMHDLCQFLVIVIVRIFHSGA